jgi:hypothetical protein
MRLCRWREKSDGSANADPSYGCFLVRESNMIQNCLFSKNYDWEILPGLPGKIDIINFPPEERFFSEGLVVEIKPYGEKPWIANFHGASKDYMSGIYSTPQIDKMCVVTNGAGFIVDAYEPNKAISVPVLPVVEVHLLADANIMIFISFTVIAGFGLDGFVWKTKVSCDGIHVKNICGGSINGFAWDSTKGIEVDFSVKIDTGTLIGGTCTK